MRLYTKDQIEMLNTLLVDLLKTIHDIMKEHVDTIMPGFTHLQKAQPITFSSSYGSLF